MTSLVTPPAAVLGVAARAAYGPVVRAIVDSVFGGAAPADPAAGGA
jgi:hypothetical protein